MDKVDLFLPLALAAVTLQQNRRDENYNIMVRLKSGVSLQQARADVDRNRQPRIREKDERDRSFWYGRGRAAEPASGGRRSSSTSGAAQSGGSGVADRLRQRCCQSMLLYAQRGARKRK